MDILRWHLFYRAALLTQLIFRAGGGRCVHCGCHFLLTHFVVLVVGLLDLLFLNEFSLVNPRKSIGLADKSITKAFLRVRLLLHCYLVMSIVRESNLMAWTVFLWLQSGEECMT